MKGIIEFAHRRAWPVLLVILIITLIATSQFRYLRLDVSPQGLIVKDNPNTAIYEDALASFGSGNITVVVVHDPELHEPETLRAIQQVVKELDRLPFVEQTDSLFSVPNLRLEEEYILADPFLARSPASAGEARGLLADSLANPFVSDNLLSSDLNTLAINVHLVNRSQYEDFDAYAASRIEEVIAPLNGVVEQAFQIGLPFVRMTIANSIIADQAVILPVSLLVLLVTLVVLSRSLSIGFVPLLTSVVSICWMLGVMGFLDIPITVMTAIVPALMIIMGSTEDVHLVAEFMEGKRQRLEPRDAIRYMARRKGLAVLLTFCTTYLGFLSIGLNRIEILQDFGIVASTGLAFNFLITVTLVPIYLRFFGRYIRTAESEGAPPQFIPVLRLICHLVNKRRFETVLWFAGLSIIGIIGAGSLNISNNVMDYFQDDSPIKQRSALIHERLAGMDTFMIVLNGNIEGTFQKVRYLEEIRVIQQYLADSGSFDKSVSYADFVGLVNSVLNESPAIELPEDNDVLGEIQIFLEHDMISSFVNEDYSKAVILVRHGIGSSLALNTALADLEQFIAGNVTDKLAIDITGESVLISQAADYVVGGQGKSLLLMLVIIFLVIALLFVNPKVGLLAVIPNVFPIIMLFGVMGFEGIPLDTGTAMIAAVAIGICVDDTMHFMVRYNEELEQTHDEQVAMVNTIHSEALPIMSTSVALAAGFLVLAFSSFTPIAYFGALSAMVMLVAVVADFLLTPILLASTRLVTIWDLMSVEIREQLIQECRLFRGMRPWHVRKLILMGSVRQYEAGDIIMEQGARADEMFILLDGSVELQIEKQGETSKFLSTAVTGRVFGAIAMQEGARRIATGVAVGPSRVLVMSWSNLERVAKFYPRISTRFFQNLSAMLGRGLAERMLV